MKKYTSERGSVTALSGISLDVKEGEFLTIVGPSGCGKSTLLNILVGLETPSSGTVVLDGAKAVDRRAVGYVMQNDNLYPWRTLRENVEFPLELTKIYAIERVRVIALGVSLDKPMEDSKRHIAIINDEGQEISRVPINSQPLPGPSRHLGIPLSRSRTAEPSALAAELNGSVPGIEIA